MLNLDVHKTEDLIYMLKRQVLTPMISTYSPCPNCGSPSRGGGVCQICISREIEKRVGEDWADKLLYRMREFQHANNELSDVIGHIRRM